MNLSTVKRQIYRMDLDQIAQIQKYCKKRAKTIRYEKYAIRMAKAWDWAKTVPLGAEIWCGAEGMFLGGTLQRGDKLIVYSIQPRKKVLWVKRNGKFIGFGPAMIVRYGLQSEPVTDPLSPAERRMAEAGGKILKDVLG